MTLLGRAVTSGDNLYLQEMAFFGFTKNQHPTPTELKAGGRNQAESTEDDERRDEAKAKEGERRKSISLLSLRVRLEWLDQICEQNGNQL